MVHVPLPQDHPFQEVEMIFDLERLKSDLEQYEKITPRPWDYFLGILSGYNQREISEKFGVSEKTVEQALIQRGIRSSLISILDLHEDDYLDWNRIPKLLLDAGYGLSEQKTCIVLDQEIFKNMLDEQRKKLTSNSLASKNGFRSNRNFDDVYVPLGLVKPKEEPKRDFKNVENDPMIGSQFYGLADYEITEKFSNTEFFEKVLNQEKTHRLAIVGEPGAGKTTLLQKISTWVEKENPDAQIIWVSLVKLKNKSLKDYLLDEWLKNAKDVSETTKAEKDALINTFKAGSVWLLLDGVDEMGINDPLFNLHEQITGCWLKYAKIILSCRLNVWEVGINHLHDFEVYRNLDFSEPERDQFIKNWFEENLPLGEQLITELNQDGKERIRDLTKNPLRLTMICFSWQKNKGKLPNTKAELYKECVDAFYDWKAKEVFSTTPKERKELNQALGELAKNALEQDSAWFRITHQQICECEYLGNPNEEGLRKKAIELGWLNEVGVAEENPDEQVYAFFHPSFQEYFAALAIDDWTFFLNHNNENPNPFHNYNNQKCVYRIFKKQWIEVVLFWIISCQNNDLEKSITTLINYNDGCKSWTQKLKGFYEYKSHFIALKLLGEINKKEIIEMVLTSLFVDTRPAHTVDKNTRVPVVNPWECETNKSLGVFLDLLIFEGIKSSNTLTIKQVLKEKLSSSSTYNILINSNIYYHYIIKYIEGEKKESSPTDLKYLEESIFSFIYMLERNHKKTIEIKDIKAKESSGKSNSNIDIDKLLKKLLELIESSNYMKGINHNDFGLCLNIISFLGRIGIQKSDLVNQNTLIKMIRPNADYLLKFEVAKAILNISSDNVDAINILEDLVKSTDPFTSFSAACFLIEKSSGHLDIFSDIMTIMKSSSSEDTFFRASKSLAVIKSKSRLNLVIKNLKCCLDDENYNNDFNRFRDSYELFWNCSEYLSYPEFYKVWHSQPEIIHPEIREISPFGNTAIAQTLNQQILDLPSQLQLTEKTYPLIINAQSLEDETDNSSIAQEICNQIYAIAFPDETNIPEINNAPQLKRLIPNIKKQLGTKNLALIFHNREPNESLIKFCKKLSDSIHIKWITEQTIENGIPSQENLVNILQNWLNQLD